MRKTINQYKKLKEDIIDQKGGLATKLMEWNVKCSPNMAVNNEAKFIIEVRRACGEFLVQEVRYYRDREAIADPKQTHKNKDKTNRTYIDDIKDAYYSLREMQNLLKNNIMISEEHSNTIMKALKEAEGLLLFSGVNSKTAKQNELELEWVKEQAKSGKGMYFLGSFPDDKVEDKDNIQRKVRASFEKYTSSAKSIGAIKATLVDDLAIIYMKYTGRDALTRIAGDRFSPFQHLANLCMEKVGYQYEIQSKPFKEMMAVQNKKNSTK